MIFTSVLDAIIIKGPPKRKVNGGLIFGQEVEFLRICFKKSEIR